MVQLIEEMMVDETVFSLSSLLSLPQEQGIGIVQKETWQVSSV